MNTTIISGLLIFSLMKIVSSDSIDLSKHKDSQQQLTVMSHCKFPFLSTTKRLLSTYEKKNKNKNVLTMQCTNDHRKLKDIMCDNCVTVLLFKTRLQGLFSGSEKC